MKIIKLILLAFPLFLASILLVANPAKALSLKSAPATQAIAVVSTQHTDLAAPKLTLASNPSSDGIGCNCASCVQAKLQMLQGKLPSVGF